MCHFNQLITVFLDTGLSMSFISQECSPIIILSISLERFLRVSSNNSICVKVDTGGRVS